jgi:hypothetical protein
MIRLAALAPRERRKSRSRDGQSTTSSGDHALHADRPPQLIPSARERASPDPFPRGARGVDHSHAPIPRRFIVAISQHHELVTASVLLILRSIARRFAPVTYIDAPVDAKSAMYAAALQEEESVRHRAPLAHHGRVLVRSYTTLAALLCCLAPLTWIATGLVAGWLAARRGKSWCWGFALGFCFSTAGVALAALPRWRSPGTLGTGASPLPAGAAFPSTLEGESIPATPAPAARASNVSGSGRPAPRNHESS